MFNSSSLYFLKESFHFLHMANRPQDQQAVMDDHINAEVSGILSQLVTLYPREEVQVSHA